MTQTFTGSTTWTIPAGVTSLTIECWGPGGAGGDRNYNPVYTGGGGGGAYSKLNTLSVTPGNSVEIIVGYNDNRGLVDHSQAEYPFHTIVCFAEGGKTVGLNTCSGATGGSSTYGIGDIKYSGGNGGTGFYTGVDAGSYGGGGGEGSATNSNGNNGSGSTGGTGTDGGNGGNGGTYSVNGVNGTTPGGGGGGVYENGPVRNFGWGGDGQVKITYSLYVNLVVNFFSEFF